MKRDFMRLGSRFLPFVVALLAFPPVLGAQDSSREPPLALGDFNVQGSAAVGYRFTDIKGYKPQFLQLFDLQKGFRLQDFNVFGESRGGVNPFLDSFSLSTSGLGGDPFPTAQLVVTRYKLH